MHPSDRNLYKGPFMSPHVFIKEAVRLKFEMDRSDHTKDSINSFRHIDQDLYSQILFLQNTLENQRQEETNEFHLLKSNMEQAISLVRKDIGEKEELEDDDKEYYQKYLNDLYGKINIFKALGGRAWDYILDEEMKLTREIDRFISEMESWEGEMPQERLPRWTSRPFSANLPIESSSSKDNDQIDSDVNLFRKFLLQFGGHSGGWKTNDHTQFLKILKKHKSEIELALQEIQSVFPDKTDKEILSHHGWYKKYKVLKRNHLKALQIWKSKKKFKTEDNIVLEEEKKPVQKSEKTREEERTRIQAWKQQKKSTEEERRKKEDHEKQVLQQRRQDEWKQKRQKLARLLQERQVAPSTTQEMHPPSAAGGGQVEDRRRPRTTPPMVERIRHFQEQDREHVARLLELKTRRKQSENKDKEISKKTVRNVSVERDPTRIHRSTKASRERSKPISQENRDQMPEAFKPVPNIRKVPKLKIPEWRKKNE